MNLVIFRRDLRIEDNQAIAMALKAKEPLAFIFIYNKKQINQQKNPYFSKNGFDFLNQALKQLNEKINLNIFISDNDLEVLDAINKKQKINNIFINLDLTNFAQTREQKIVAWCQKNQINCHLTNDYYTIPPEMLLLKNKKPYYTFRPFYQLFLNNLHLLKINKYQTLSKNESLVIAKNQYSRTIFKVEKKITLPTSRVKVFQQIKNQKKYQETRDFPALNATSLISPSLKFGIVSYREALILAIKQYGKNNPFVRQLIWKDFFYHFYNATRSTYILRGKHPSNILTDYDNWEYDNNQLLFNKWAKGETGFPLVDAAMHQLNKTGFMHNRVRMLVACFLTKHLNIDWRWGERYFATKLYDYDPIVNNQSWQWCAGTGLDYQGSWRLLSPERQQKRFDPERKYLHHYLPINYQAEPIIDLAKARNDFLKKRKEFHAKIKNN